MIEIDITDLDLFSKSIVYHMLATIEEYRFDEKFFDTFTNSLININDDMIELLKSIMMKNTKEFIIINEGHVVNLNYDYSSPYVLFKVIQETLDRFDYVLYALEDMKKEDIYELFSYIESSVIHLNTGISNLYIRRAQSQGKFDWHEKYMPAPLYIGISQDNLKLIKTILYDLEVNVNDNIFMNWAKAEVLKFKYLYQYFEFQLTFLFILNSPFYSEETKYILETVTNKLRLVLHNSYINRIYIQSIKQPDENLSHEERGATNYTTRIQIFFVQSNFDTYSLRVDLPHKGIPIIHFNMHEFDKETGFPIVKKDVVELRKRMGETNYKKLFFEYEERVMFRANFKLLLNEVILDEEIKNEILQLFGKKCHEIIEDNQNEEVFLESLDEYQKALNMFTMYRPTNLKKDKLDINSIMDEARGLSHISAHCIFFISMILGDSCVIRDEEGIKESLLVKCRNICDKVTINEEDDFSKILGKFVSYYIENI